MVKMDKGLCVGSGSVEEHKSVHYTSKGQCWIRCDCLGVLCLVCQFIGKEGGKVQYGRKQYVKAGN